MLHQYSNDNDTEMGLMEATSVASFKKKIFKEFMNFRDAREILMLTSAHPDTVEDWLNRIRELEEVSDNAGEEIPKPDGKMRKRDFWDFRKAKKIFIDEMIVDFNMRVNSINDLGRMAVFNDEELLYQPFYDFNPDSLIYAFHIQKEGIIASVSGVMGSGKTDFSLFLVELLLQSKTLFHIVTNIWLSENTLNENSDLFYKDNMIDLLLQLCECAEMDGHTVVAMDETSLFFSRREPGKKSNIQFEKFLRLIRKYNCSIIFIEQVKDGLPGVALDLRTVVYHKTGKKKLFYSTISGQRNYNNYLSSIPRTILEFDTKHMGSFDLNIDLEALYEHVKGKKNPIKATREFIGIIKENESKTTEGKVLEFIKNHEGCIKTHVAKSLEMHKGYIGDIVDHLKETGKVQIILDGNKHRLKAI